MPDQAELKVNLESRGNATILAPEGEIDLLRAPSLREHLSRALDDGPSRLVVNLAAVDYMDSSGLATLIEGLKKARTTETQLVLCSLHERVRSIFEIARLEMVFTIVDDVDAALA